MVAKLPEPPYDDLEILEKVISERQGGKNKRFFNEYRNEWVQRTREYHELKGDPTRIRPSSVSDVDKGKFVNLYSNAKEGDAQHEAIRTMRDTKILFCPSCGEDGNPETLDHHLPKDVFPEYAITTRNLTPMCGRCQGEKLATVVDEYGQRQYLHPYFDDINHPILGINIIPPYDKGTTFDIYVLDGIPERISDVTPKHLRQLKIDVRLREYCIEKYMHILKTAKEDQDLPREGLVYTIRHMKREEEKKSPNAWAAAFYRAILSDERLMQYLVNDPLPDYL